jgi:4-hydroxy-3-methylbut-2-en-1-yl diphosphate reductase
MNIHIAEHYGLCFGVRDAIAQAERLAAEAPLTILGELVHNPIVRERLAASGVVEGSLRDVGAAQTAQVMITAHGASDRDRVAWRAAGYGVADGTCPLVRHAHDQLRVLVDLGCFPVVIGQRAHVEVRGLTGDFPEAVVLENEADLAQLPAKSRFGVVSQTTQPIERVHQLVAALRECFPQSEVIFRDTVCQPTKNRQSALRRLLEVCDTIVVVGGQNSNNTRALADAVRSAGRRAIHVTQAADLRPEWFAAAREVGVTAGTSTLKETVTAVIARLETFGRPQSSGGVPPSIHPPSSERIPPSIQTQHDRPDPVASTRNSAPTNNQEAAA